MSEVALIVERFRVAAAELASIIEDAAYGGFTPHIAAFVREEVSDALRPILKVLVALPESTRWPIPSRDQIAIERLGEDHRDLVLAANNLIRAAWEATETSKKTKMAIDRLDSFCARLEAAAEKRLQAVGDE